DDRLYNLTCTIVGPPDSFVKSEHYGVGSRVSDSQGDPSRNILQGHLHAEHQLQSAVRLEILYGGHTPENIKVGDPLIFRLWVEKVLPYIVQCKIIFISLKSKNFQLITICDDIKIYN
ncbi:unnamed protein product, partial [Meganyctiphanes norvegica]